MNPIENLRPRAIQQRERLTFICCKVSASAHRNIQHLDISTPRTELWQSRIVSASSHEQNHRVSTHQQLPQTPRAPDLFMPTCLPETSPHESNRKQHHHVHDRVLHSSAKRTYEKEEPTTIPQSCHPYSGSGPTSKHQIQQKRSSRLSVFESESLDQVNTEEIPRQPQHQKVRSPVACRGPRPRRVCENKMHRRLKWREVNGPHIQFSAGCGKCLCSNG